jgi:hypothetical protein
MIVGNFPIIFSEFVFSHKESVKVKVYPFSDQIVLSNENGVVVVFGSVLYFSLMLLSRFSKLDTSSSLVKIIHLLAKPETIGNLLLSILIVLSSIRRCDK